MQIKEEIKMMIPAIKRTPHLDVDSVRAACVRNDLYTCGTNEEYMAMFLMVTNYPTPSDIGIYRVAKDIAEHSEDQTVTNVMYILANDAVYYTFELDGNEEA